MALEDDEAALTDFDKAIKFNAKLALMLTPIAVQQKYNLEDLKAPTLIFSKRLSLARPLSANYLYRGIVKQELGGIYQRDRRFLQSRLTFSKNDASLYNY